MMLFMIIIFCCKTDPKCRKKRFRELEIKHFPGEHAPDPLEGSRAFGARPPPPNLKHLPTTLERYNLI